MGSAASSIRNLSKLVSLDTSSALKEGGGHAMCRRAGRCGSCAGGPLAAMAGSLPNLGIGTRAEAERRRYLCMCVRV